MDRDFYFGRNNDGMTCAYDKKTHRCVDVIVSFPGDDPEYVRKNHDRWIGELDPNYKKSIDNSDGNYRTHRKWHKK